MRKKKWFYEIKPETLDNSSEKQRSDQVTKASGINSILPDVEVCPYGSYGFKA